VGENSLQEIVVSEEEEEESGLIHHPIIKSGL
jgi:hypothetical protein